MMTTSSVRVSVVICTWNRSASLRQTLRSLQLQTGIDPAAVEVIVVDNNSTDDTRRLVDEMSGDWSLGLLRYAFEPRQGKQFALNTGIELAKSPVIAFTDDDILFPVDWLQQIGQVFADCNVELAGGKTLIGWPASGRPKWYGDDMLAVLAGVDLGDVRLDPCPAEYAPAGSNLIARRTLFDRHGPFSPTHFRHMDHEFGIRCNQRGAKVVYAPKLVVLAPVDPRCLTRRYFRRWAFKAGIARSGGADGSGHGFPSVPRWIYRQCAQDALYVATLGRVACAPRAFSREMRMWRALGTIANAWHAWASPRRHGAWVQRYSQKNNGLY